ncbi:MAG: NUDIX domain-containing protein [Candidatus Promineifilaceae bacterium]|nr:NUDIX domain-containing protein [Candidatus Promineifilaceae bacterium]
MSTSYLDWIRRLVGRRKIFLPFASVIVRDDRSRVLLQKRTDFGVWGLPGGVLELEEDLKGCARREVKEETGLELGNLSLVGVYTDPRYDVIYPNGDQVQQFTVCFEGQVNGGQMMPDGVETSEQHFFDPSKLKDLDIPLWYRDMIADAQNSNGPAFKPPFSSGKTTDQIADVRPSVGHDLISAVGASVVIQREDGRLLMLQHKHESSWRLPAGFSNLGENVAQTAVREVWEETRLRIHPERIIGIHSSPLLNVTYPNGDQTRNVGVVFQGRLLGGVLEIDDGEINALEWMTPENALASYDSSRQWLFEKVLSNLDDGYFVC